MAWLVFACVFADDTLANQSPWRAWAELLERSVQQLGVSQDELEDIYELKDYDRAIYDQSSTTLIFHATTKSSLEVEFLHIGTFSTTSDTWIWAWNESPWGANHTNATNFMKAIGDQAGYIKLQFPQWSAEIVDAWEMSAVANFLLNGKGVYRRPFHSGYYFLLITSIRDAKR